jgi:2,5-diamino-6-(ribosylamino)-4(3H)-pyrimidinone 5'-phosphate reductase
MLPYVILHNAISLDGKVTGFDADIGAYYELASTWKEDATLVGADTMLSAPDEIPPEDDSAFQPWPQMENDTRPLLVIPDSHGRVRSWHYLKTLPYWRGGIALCSKTTPPEHLAYLDARRITRITAGDTHVDMRAALEELYKSHGVKTLRMDSGGTLNGIMLLAGLVSEISLLIHPQLVGSADVKSFLITHQPCGVRLELAGVEKRGEALVWLRYKVPDSK